MGTDQAVVLQEAHVLMTCRIALLLTTEIAQVLILQADQRVQLATETTTTANGRLT